MVQKYWERIKRQYCQHVRAEVYLEAEAVYPSEHLPDQPPHLRAHRCSRGLECNQENKPACIWAGTNPNIDPF